MALLDTDARIERLLGIKQEHPVTIQTGQDALPPSSPASAGQTDITLRNDYAAANAADKAERERIAASKAAVQEIVQPSNVPDPAVVVAVGNVSIFPNPILGTYESQFTRHAQSDYIIAVDGKWVSPSEGLAIIYDALKASVTTKEKK